MTTIRKCDKCNLVWDLQAETCAYWRPVCPQCGSVETMPVEEQPSLKCTPTKPADIEAIKEAITNKVLFGLPDTKQRLEALRDKWKAEIKSLRDWHAFSHHHSTQDEAESAACGIDDCLDDLQKEIDLLP